MPRQVMAASRRKGGAGRRNRALLPRCAASAVLEVGLVSDHADLRLRVAGRDNRFQRSVGTGSVAWIQGAARDQSEGGRGGSSRSRAGSGVGIELYMPADPVPFG